MPTSRLEAFSDGVLAIIITIMVLELKVPDGDDFAALKSTTGLGLLTYLLSFVYIGIYWNNHHHMFQLTERVSGGILWANLHLLFWLSLFPFSTAWMDDSHLARVPVICYGVNLMAAAVAYWCLQTVIVHTQGPVSTLAQAVGRDAKGKASPALYLAGIAAALLGGDGRVGVYVGMAFFVAVAVLWLVPDRRIERAIAAGRARQEG
jgi:uncharacterized membrane protein